MFHDNRQYTYAKLPILLVTETSVKHSILYNKIIYLAMFFTDPNGNHLICTNTLDRAVSVQGQTFITFCLKNIYIYESRCRSSCRAAVFRNELEWLIIISRLSDV